MVYLDYSATTPVNSEVLDTFALVSNEYIGNPNSLHKLGSKSKNLIDDATCQIKSILNIDDKDEFIYIIKRVLNGKKFYDSELLQYTIHNEKTNNEIDLTNREKCVLNYVCKGLSNKDIANELKVTDYTIKKHVSNILSKLHLRSRQDIILYAQDNHIIDEII